jgi:hypothetical protein
MTGPEQTARKADKNGLKMGKNELKEARKDANGKKRTKDTTRKDKAGAPPSGVACLAVVYTTIIYVDKIYRI